ncbi:methionyl-tRNA formyltransferase [Pareuzebyella sediminis]|uniref:methionyl-tRNA formyltransferase n=1 Tax=Pareuzebyella sediminis TaxID=2607998 RepID=UPI0011EED2E6|nr:methionyl-tRNA formyltransferase [Pareuzebyella sediminis]
MKSAKKRELRIVFMGTPEFATASLARLIEEGYRIVGVITAPDKPAGRGRKLQQSDVKRFAITKGLKIMQPTNLKDETFLSQLKALNANLQIVVAFRMLPKAVWAMPVFGTFNLHASLLPDYRGAAPINWAIINGESQTGVTTFFIDDKIDTGEIILQEKVAITEEETAGMLHDKLMEMGAELVHKTVRAIEHDQVETKLQQGGPQLNIAHKIYKDTCRIDWTMSLNTIYNKIRGMSPYPTAWTKLLNGDEELMVKVYLARKERKEHQWPLGKLFSDKKELKVAVDGGFIYLLELQLPGRKKMKIQDVLNGLTLHEDAKVC